MNDIDLYRRIDWRFLLPGPLPRQVGYLGASGTNLDALEKVAKVTQIRRESSKESAKGQKQDLELVVVTSSATAEVVTAARSVAQGGMLYWEIRRGTGLRRALIRRPARLLRQMGFSDVQLFWHRPDFERCLEIVPINRADALTHFLSRNCVGVRRTLVAGAARYLVRTGIFPQLVSCLGILAVRSRT